MTSKQQLAEMVHATRFCTDNRPRFINPMYWDNHVAAALADLANTTDHFDPEDAWWEVMDRVRADRNALKEVKLREDKQ
jgi:hypothetical protein